MSRVDIDLPEPEKVANTYGDANLKVGPCAFLCEFLSRDRSCLGHRTASDDDAILCSI